MATITDPKEAETAWNQQYEGLARQFSSLLPSKKTLLVEVGCGKGQLTIPLAGKGKNHHIIAVDSYRTPFTRRDCTFRFPRAPQPAPCRRGRRRCRRRRGACGRVGARRRRLRRWHRRTHHRPRRRTQHQATGADDPRRERVTQCLCFCLAFAARFCAR